jgi:hypothetical protein
LERIWLRKGVLARKFIGIIEMLTVHLDCMLQVVYPEQLRRSKQWKLVS